MKVCKLYPDGFACKNCMDGEKLYGQTRDCSKCNHNSEYELLLIGTGFWSGDYAMVQKDGKIKKVALCDVYDVKEI